MSPPLPDTTSAGARRRRILTLALPIIGGMVSQNVLNLVDAYMVGHLGDVSLAAVGAGGFLNFVTTAFILGVSAGVQAMSARRVGEGRVHETAVPLNGGLLLSLGLAVPWSLFLFAQAPALYSVVTTDPAVVDAGVPYLRWRLVAMAPLAMNFAFRGFWNATDRSMYYMGSLVVMHSTNIALNAVLIYGLFGVAPMGAEGAGLASAIATYLGFFAYMALGFRDARPEGFLRGLPDRETLRSMVRLSIPAGLQQLFFAAGMTAFVAIVGRMGTREQAATHIIMQLLLVGVLPGLGFGLASASLVGQALGRRDPEDARRWAWEVTRIAMGVVFVVALPAMLWPARVAGLFLRDPVTLALATGPLRLIALTLFVDTIGSVLMNSLVGAGATRAVMIIATGLQWGVFLPAAYLIGPVLGHGLLAVFAAQVVYRMLQSGAFAWQWQRGAWQHIKL
ncbi:MAG: MATE family efflux transporter [Sandaracinaceae bacterium]|jgi:MATE family multidrug resistance protein|nr:MATE family efflux transporter [Sandaracinaceae bacterium]MBP7683284.1 MATE family efflux transporter [Deltaproteobacteria bacterium]MBK6813683.1 MATE family efflux transporter [Sandaracinaceae bacterium]MBK7154158.1 MATE family efflux transporter [Sandaracinaceae bacterium]MBK7776305.1 MATE family efflux transporter [Sandaracinaceae bacterium]